MSLLEILVVLFYVAAIIFLFMAIISYKSTQSNHSFLLKSGLASGIVASILVTIFHGYISASTGFKDLLIAVVASMFLAVALCCVCKK